MQGVSVDHIRVPSPTLQVDKVSWSVYPARVPTLQALRGLSNPIIIGFIANHLSPHLFTLALGDFVPPGHLKARYSKEILTRYAKGSNVSSVLSP